MRAGGISSAQVTSSLLESVSTMSSGARYFRKSLFQGEREFIHFVKSLCYQVESGDLIAYGLIPEFIGRFPILVSLAALNEDQLVQVA
jgi:ATP-dependent Clp protease ATP-binding subunit ClpX